MRVQLQIHNASGRPTHVASGQPQEQPAAVLLLSGGLDSYTAGAIAREEGFACMR